MVLRCAGWLAAAIRGYRRHVEVMADSAMSARAGWQSSARNDSRRYSQCMCGIIRSTRPASRQVIRVLHQMKLALLQARYSYPMDKRRPARRTVRRTRLGPSAVLIAERRSLKVGDSHRDRGSRAAVPARSAEADDRAVLADSGRVRPRQPGFSSGGNASAGPLLWRQSRQVGRRPNAVRFSRSDEPGRTGSSWDDRLISAFD